MFKKGNVFEGGGVKDKTWMMKLEYLIEQITVLDTTEMQGAAMRIFKGRLQIEEIGLRGFEEDKRSAGSSEPLGYGRSDAPACTCDKDRLTCKFGDLTG